MKKISHRMLGIGFLLVTGGFAAGYYAASSSSSPGRELRQNGYSLISPLLDCQETDRAEFFGSGSRLEKKVKDQVKSYNDMTISVYYRDLFNGPSFNILPGEKFAPASLTKIPLLMVYLKHAEEEPSILQKKLRYERTADDLQVLYPPERTLQEGEMYTVEQLLFYLIVYSDNGARSTLIRDVFESAGKTGTTSAVSIDSYSKLFSDLGLGSPDDEEPRMTARQIAGFFRALYNATYLNRKYSEQALNVLSKTTFSHGLSKQIGAGTKIAHKFAEHLNDGYRELHDCGIVYKPKRPYILCVLTRGKNNDRQAEAIAEISKTVFTAADG